VDAVAASVALGLGTRADEAALLAQRGVLRAWLADGIVLRTADGPCAAEPDGARLVQRDGERHVALDVVHRCAGSLDGLELTDDTVFDDDPDHETLVAVRGGGEARVHVLRADARSVTLVRAHPEPASRRTAATAIEMVAEGGRHLLGGWDHLLFLLTLLFGAALVAARQGLRRGLRDVALLVTAFTVGHSVSLAAATLGRVELPSQLVETGIAASIVAVAVANVVRPEETRARPWLVLVFGIVHGFGFSSVLAEMGLAPADTVVALLSFNLGIELAQLAFVAVALVPLAWLARHRVYPRAIVRPASLAIGALACLWLVERALGA